MGNRSWKHGILSGIYITLFFCFLLPKCSHSQASFKLQTTEVLRHPMQELVGIYLEEQRGRPLFYDTFFPVVYEIPAPTWNASSLRLQLPKNQSFANVSELLFCNDTSNSTDLWASTLCPITLKLNELLDKFAEQMKVFETFNASLTKLDSKFSSCHEIKPHFSNHIIDDIEVELYLVQVLLDCPMSDIIHEKIIIPQPNGEKYMEILRLFLETHISPRFRIIGYSKYAISTNTLLSLHTTELLDYLLHSFQWTTAINTCQSQRIPRLLINSSKLRDTLAEVETSIEEHGYTLTVPVSDISNYYKLPIADCIMTTTNTYIVRLLVPLTKKDAGYKMFHVKSIPFLNRDNDSNKAMICEHRAVEGPVIVEGKTTITLTPVASIDCDESELCRVPPSGDKEVFSKCIYSALRNDSYGMIESCHMTCIPYDTSYLPFIKRIRSDQFVIVGKSSADMTVVCKREEKPFEVVDIPEWVGSLIITLPCSCYLSHRSEKFEINGGCDFKLEFMPVRPKGWSDEDLLARFHRQELFKKLPLLAILNASTNGDDLTEKDVTEDFNKLVMTESPSCAAIWTIYLVYIFVFVGGVLFTFGFFILRNVFVRVGQLEISTALNSNGRKTQYDRDAPVQFNARATFPAEDSIIY